jgi:uncharacterized protein
MQRLLSRGQSGDRIGRLRICIYLCIIMPVKIVWDESKQRANLKKHGLDFADAALALAGVTCTFEDARFDYGEQRFITLGLLHDTAVVIAHTETAREVRIISMRKATMPCNGNQRDRK